jgi:hypothetical protein
MELSSLSRVDFKRSVFFFTLRDLKDKQEIETEISEIKMVIVTRSSSNKKTSGSSHLCS